MLERTSLILSLALVACGGSAGSDVLGPAANDVPADASPTPTKPALVAPVPSEDAGTDGSTAADSSVPDASDAGTDAAVDSGDAGQVIDPPPPPPPPPPTYYGVSFDRASLQRLQVPFPNGVNGSDKLTIEGWFDVRQPTDEGSLFAFTGGSCSYAGSPGYGAMVGHLNCVTRMGGIGSPAYQVFSQQAITLGKWTHVALVLSNGKFTLFVDGTSQGTTTPNYSTVPNEGFAFTVGGTGKATNETFDGVVDEFRVSLAADYAADFAPPAHLGAGLVSLSLDENAGVSVGAGAGTLLGGPSWTTVAR